MDFEKKHEIIQQIMLGIHPLEYKSKIYLFKEPSHELNIKANVLYNTYYDKAKKEGFLTREQESKLLKENNLWNVQIENRLNTIEKDLIELEKQEKNYEFNTPKLEYVKKLKRAAVNERDRIMQQKLSLTSNTCEYQAKKSIKEFILRNCIYNIGDNLVWPTVESFENEDDLSFIGYLFRSIFVEGLYSEKELRLIARSEPWRTYWKTSSKNGVKLFNNHIGLTQYQYMLSYWSNIYDMVYESYKPPDKDTIEDDELLNKWLISKVEEREKDSEAQSNGLGIANQKIASSQEIFIPVGSKEDAKKVYQLNDTVGKQVFNARQKQLASKGQIKHAHLNDVKRDLMMKINSLSPKE